MGIKRILFKKSIIVIITFFTIFMVVYIKAINMLPQNITMLQGDEYSYDLKNLFPMVVKIDKDEILNLNGNKSKDKGVLLNNSTPMAIKSEKFGTVNLDIKMLWFFPLRSVQVDIIPNRVLAACGNTIGVRLKSDGIMVKF